MRRFFVNRGALLNTITKLLVCTAGFVLYLSGCQSGDGSDSASGDWYYHWNCNGDSQCLSTNPNGTATGTNDEGPDEANCTQLLQFAQNFWGSAATDSCDQSPGGGSGTGGGGTPACDEICAIENGPSAAGGTSYWNIYPGGLPGFTKFAIYADGTGQLYASGLSISTPAVLPSSQTFSWSKLSSNVILISNLADVLIGAYGVNAPHTPAYFVISTMTVTGGGTSTGRFTATATCNPVGGTACDNPDISGSLVSGSFNEGVLLSNGSACSANNQCQSGICPSCGTSAGTCSSTKVICN